ncbi:MAG: DUF4259 domain-containing protein [Gordonia sp. (in: high G+C Gram-positive bacteria)]
MGAWGSGVFDNDDAADWLVDFDEAAPADRPAVIGDVLQQALDEDYLEADLCSSVIAAAALVRQTLPGAPTYRELSDLGDAAIGELVAVVDAALIRKAVDALNVVLDPESEWSELWGEVDGVDEAAAPVREMLGAFASSTA